MPHPSDPADDVLALPPPRMAQDVLLGHLAAHWGLAGRLSPLTSERDLNHRLSALSGRYTVKLANAAEPLGMTDFQTRALLHVAAADPGLPAPRPVPMQDGGLWLDLPEGRLRVLTWLEGRPMADTPRSPAQARATGAALARLARALAGFRHPEAGHVLLWDIRQVPLLGRLVPGLPDAALRAEAEAFIADFTFRVAPALERMPAQVCHSDFNPHNLLTDPADPAMVTGIIDFGDMVQTARICDVAIAAAYQVDPADPLPGLQALLAGYTATLPLARDEIALLFDLIQARAITTLVIAGWRAARYPGNAAYILRNTRAARTALDALAGLGRERVTRALAEASGTDTAR